MSTTIVFPDDNYASLAAALLNSDSEQCAILLATSFEGSHGTRFLVREQFALSPADYVQQSRVSAVLSPDVVLRASKEARRRNLGLVFAHTHPHSSGFPSFSLIDDAGEKALAEFLGRRSPVVPSAALVLGPEGCSARLVGKNVPVRVVEAGSMFRFQSEIPGVELTDALDRQVRAFGKEGQALLGRISVGIVGLGGTGSVVAQQLAYLGVRHYVLMDPDVVEMSNLNRLVGAGPQDLDRPKVDVASDQIRRIVPDSSVVALKETVLEDTSAKKLLGVDLLFCCTDSHGSRAVLNQLAYQYYIPCVDMGVSLSAPDGRLTHIAGRVQLLAPGLGCLTCGELLDASEVRRDFMIDAERRADPYFIEGGEPQPAVVSINSTVASLAVTMFLSIATHIPARPRYQTYDGISGRVKSVEHLPHKDCIVCSSSGSLGRGSQWPLPTRMSL